MNLQNYWDEKYRGRDRLFSGEPNGVLVAEAAGLPPGQALDVGCGEGADAVWLAAQGWRVTAVDISRTALQRAAAAATEHAEDIAWQHGDPTASSPPSGAFDLVTVQYFPLRREPGHAALSGLLDAVAPGGTLLFVGHDLDGLSPERHAEAGDYYAPHAVAELLGEEWTVLVDETRPRAGSRPEGSPHTHDTVLRARRER
ncbi:class I SAM-dependent methyltransferase [Salininema proteolyticum]|uniref:Class I SAM-dependent methyltransferase n=1 Tax=Salininema proteolyticum TaxID=1607685 RepID=A0ABV8TZA4_9ACTN